MRESTAHRLAFDAYVALGGDRSLKRLHVRLLADPHLIGRAKAPTLRALERWSAAFHWPDRLADLEQEARRQDAADLVAALREMNERHAQEGLALQQRALRRLQNLADEEVSAPAAIRALAEGVHLERLARGDVTDRTQIERTSPDDDALAGFSLAELRALATLAETRASGDRPAEPERPG